MASLIWKPVTITSIDPAVVTVATVTYTFEPGVAKDVSVHHVAAVTTALQAISSGTVTAGPPEI